MFAQIPDVFRSFTAACILSLAPVLFLSAAVSAEPAERRVALVIGNSNYRSVGSLTSPAADAKLVARTLGNLGFTLVGEGPMLDLDKAAFDHAVQEFGERLKGARVGVLYYSGHGVERGGRNFLAPVDTNPQKPSDYDFQFVDVQTIVSEMDDSGAGLKIIILDACRNDPFGNGQKGIGQGGFEPMDPPAGTLMLYGAAANHSAPDNGLYAKALVSAMQTPGLDVFNVFNTVGRILLKETADSDLPQTQWMSTSPIDGDFYFAGLPKGDRQVRAPEIVVQQHLDSANNSLAALPPTRSPSSQAPSDNPPTDLRFAARKQLASIGVPWGEDRFFQALKEKDYDSIELFLEGGMKISSESILVGSIASGAFDAKMTALIMKYHGLDAAAACPAPKLWTDADPSMSGTRHDLFDRGPAAVYTEYLEFQNDPQMSATFRTLCSDPAVLSNIRETIAKAEAYTARFKDDGTQSFPDYKVWRKLALADIEECKRLMAYLENK
jgi:uncharacterized caspase-like protein